MPKHGRDAARNRQGNPSPKERAIREPRIVLGGVYSTQDLIDNLEVSDKTISAWVRDGLFSFSRGTKTQFFLADDLIEYWRRANTGK